MAQYELILPKMGESVAEATIIKWEKNPGDNIDVDDIVLEVATDKVDSEVPSPVKGNMVKHLFNDGEIAQVGDVIAIIEIEDSSDNNVKQPENKVLEATEDIKKEEDIVIPFVPEQEEIADENETQEYVKDNLKFYSPLVKSIAQEEGIAFEELDKIVGTGVDGRVTKSDLLDYIESKKGVFTATKQERVSEPINIAKDVVYESYEASKQSSYVSPASVATSISGSDEIIEMDRMRKMIADHMISSKQISAHVSSFIETDVTNLVQWRNKVKNSFEKREQEKITFTPIFVEAVAKAIKDMPMINISLNGTQIIKKKDINIGMATALPNGNLIVPVIKNADQLNLVGLTKSVNDLAARARINKLKPDEIQGGTFTITNIGGFGNIMGTPIINQPQVAILAVGVIKKKPAVIETEHGDMIGIRHMMYMSMSYDHRVVDGALGGMFLKRVSDYLEQWNVNREI